MDYVASVVSDVMMGFGGSKNTLSLALELKDAFNTVLPGTLIDGTRDLVVPVRLLYLVSFLVGKRNLFHSSYGGNPRACGIGVPQGGFLSPLLFNLTLRELGQDLPTGVKVADDLLICHG